MCVCVSEGCQRREMEYQQIQSIIMERTFWKEALIVEV